MPCTKIILSAIVPLITMPVVTMGCGTVNPVVINESINIQSAYKLIQSNKGNPDFIIIDVRTLEEFNAGHIDKAIVIDYYSPDFKQKLNELERNKQYLIYCRTGGRSAAASKIMKELGFRTVYNMAGGITEWKAEGLPVVN